MQKFEFEQIKNIEKHRTFPQPPPPEPIEGSTLRSCTRTQARVRKVYGSRTRIPVYSPNPIFEIKFCSYKTLVGFQFQIW